MNDLIRHAGLAERANRQAGRSIVELMIATTLGLVVLGAVLSTVISSSASTRTQDGVATLTEDAQIALNLVTGHLRMAGFSAPRLNSLPGARSANYDGAAIRGCSNEFNDVTEPDLTNVTCAAGNGPNAFSVAYEADNFNTLAVGAANTPTDCLGRPLPAQASPLGGNFFVAENRFFIRPNAMTGEPELACAGNGGAGFVAPQALITHVEDMQVTYGVSEAAIGPWGEDVFEGRVARYMDATALDTTFAAEGVMNRWLRVSSARVCLLMRTDDGLTDVPTPYIDCDGALVNPPDRRLRVAVSSTVSLRNATALPL